MIPFLINSLDHLGDKARMPRANLRVNCQGGSREEPPNEADFFCVFIKEKGFLLRVEANDEV